MPKYKVMIARFPFGGSEHPDVADWLIPTVGKMKTEKTVGDILHIKVDDTPITMSRNRAVEAALRSDVDYLMMIDSDMCPDLPIKGAEPFWDSSWAFLMKNRSSVPSIIGAPYCGPPPHENVYVFHWTKGESDNPNADISLQQFSRNEVHLLTGIKQVDALPTGLIIIDCRVFSMLPKPYFDYEWKDDSRSEKASTEDVYFTRNARMAGALLYCNWSAWAGHHKRKLVCKPQLLFSDSINQEFAEAILRGSSNERLVEVKDGKIR